MRLGRAIVWLLIGAIVELSMAVWSNLARIFTAVYKFVKIEVDKVTSKIYNKGTL